MNIIQRGGNILSAFFSWQPTINSASCPSPSSPSSQVVAFPSRDSMSLKERIAAIQERATSPTPAAGPNGSPPHASALAAKIAAFEGKGGIPVPRANSSFGIAAPPPEAKKQRAELYGNRLQPARIPSSTLGLHRPTEAFASVDPRAIALPPGDEGLSSPCHSLLPIPTRAPETTSTSSAKAVQSKQKQPAVTTRGTEFTKALEKARAAEIDGKAERRRSILFLQPQYTGGGLTPQHTGGGLTPQHTGSSGTIIAPQSTGGSSRAFSPPPISPYSPPRSPMSPRETKLSFGSASEAPATTRPLSHFFAPEEAPIVGEPEVKDEGFESPSTDAVPEESEPTPDLPSAPQLDAPPVDSPCDTTVPSVPVDQPESPAVEEKLSVHIPATEPESEASPAYEEQPSEVLHIDTDSISTNQPATPNSISDNHHHAGSATPDSVHAGLDLDAHLRHHALTGRNISAFDHSDDDDEPVYSLGDHEDDEGEYIAPLPNTLSSHRFRAHLSTITERSIEPGSPAWDVSRFSVGSSVFGGTDKRVSRRESGAYGTAFEDIYEGRDIEEEDQDRAQQTEEQNRLEEEELLAAATPGMAGVGAGVNAATTATTEPPESTSERPNAEYKVLHAGPYTRDSLYTDEPPSPSPYRLSYLTDREYTPSIGSEDGERAEDEDAFPDDADDRRTPIFYPPELDPCTPGIDGAFGTPTMRAASAPSPPFTPFVTDIPSQQMEADVQPEAARPDSMLIASNEHPRDSMASNNSRQSMLSTPRDSMLSVASSTISSSALHAQVLTLRPASTMTLPDSGSPSHVALAHRVPVTDGVQRVERGVAVYVPGNVSPLAAEDPGPTPTPMRRPNPSTIPRPRTTHELSAMSAAPSRRPGYTNGVAAPRPHTTYLSDEDEDADGIGEFGTITFGAQKPHTFSAVVHGRVREQTASTRWNGHAGTSKAAVAEKKLPLPPTPLSPGYASGDLAELLAEAAALERRLERGELPAEALRRLSRMSMRPPPKFVAPPPPAFTPLADHQMQQNVAPLNIKAQRQAQRSIRNPLGRSRSARKAREDVQAARLPASSSTSDLLESTTSISPDQVVILRTSSSSDIPPTPPPKSPGAKYFSSLRRLASTSRSLTVASPRPSAAGSEISSEDSLGVQTPSDDHAAALSSSPSMKSPSITWPSLKPKKSGSSLGSIAGKMWSRTRSKSSTSTASSLDMAHSPPQPVPVPALPAPPVLRLDPITHSSPLIPDDTDITPIAHPADIALPPSLTASKPAKSFSAPRPPNLIIHSANGSISQTPAPALGDGLLPVPKTAPERRRDSWVSSSSGTSSALPSPLFDKSIFDAFPPVPASATTSPGTRPALPSPSTNYSRTASLHSVGSQVTSESVPPLPNLSYSDNSSSSNSTTPTFSERSFGAVGGVGSRPLPKPGATGSGPYGRDHLLARVAQTQRSVQPL
ncbi:hypothetical protein MKEN_01227300 [Mycena kentingensis (nom. inval.)]|nr:hypothetical protein MKEN_01227300 [Mycena kentingensis (nom. inval.)]